MVPPISILPPVVRLPKPIAPPTLLVRLKLPATVPLAPNTAVVPAAPVRLIERLPSNTDLNRLLIKNWAELVPVKLVLPI